MLKNIYNPLILPLLDHKLDRHFEIFSVSYTLLILKFALYHKHYWFVFLAFRNLKRRKDVEKREDEEVLLQFASHNQQDISESRFEGMRPAWFVYIWRKKTYINLTNNSPLKDIKAMVLDVMVKDYPIVFILFYETWRRKKSNYYTKAQYKYLMQ